MAVGSSFAVACCLLAFSSALETQKGNFTVTPTSPGVNFTHTTTSLTSSNSTGNATLGSNATDYTSPFPSSTTRGNQTFNESTSQPSATITTPLTESTSLKTEAPHTPTVTALTTAATQTAAGYTGTPDVTAITTADPFHTANTSDSQGRSPDTSEKNLTIVFSVILGLFVVAIIVIVLHKCKQKLQYMHQPLNNSSDTEMFVAEDDTLVISGGLYDGHPIYDNVPTAPSDQSQFRLEFLH